MNPQLQKQKERFIKLYSMKDLALKSVEQCIKSYESTEISEEETECLKSSAIKLYYITQKNPLENLIYTNIPKI